MFGKKKEQASNEPVAPVATTGMITGYTPLKGRGFVRETGTDHSLFFNREGSAEFDKLSVGQQVQFLREADPLDRLRVHAIEVRPA
jgi:cold shock CspA family protein